MPALSTLVLMTTLLSCPSARAGSWVFTCTGSGSIHGTSAAPGQPDTSSTWTVPGPQTGSFGLPRFGDIEDYRSKVAVTVSVIVTATWQPDANLPSDPAPPNVWLCESAGAFWTGHSGISSDGFNDSEVPYNDWLGGGYGYGSFTSPGSSVPPAHWTKCSVSRGVATLPNRTLTAEADFTPTPGMPYGDNCGAYVDSYNVTVHPTPYNFQRTDFPDVTPPSSIMKGQGILQFHYEWDSTSGYLADDGTHSDLAPIELRENVDAPSSPTTTDSTGTLVYVTPHPFGWNSPVHFDSVTVMANAAAMVDYHSWGGTRGASLSSSFFQLYQANSFSLTQTYKFHDPATMQPGVQEIIPGAAGPFTITDGVVADSNSPSGYSFQVTKDGTPSLLQPLP